MKKVYLSRQLRLTQRIRKLSNPIIIILGNLMRDHRLLKIIMEVRSCLRVVSILGRLLLRDLELLLMVMGIVIMKLELKKMIIIRKIICLGQVRIHFLRQQGTQQYHQMNRLEVCK